MPVVKARPVLRELLAKQFGVVARAQALAAGITDEVIEGRRAGGWQRIVPGVYATFSGRLSREARLAAMVLHAGDGAVLSHETAAELAGLVDEPSALIHITVP